MERATEPSQRTLDVEHSNNFALRVAESLVHSMADAAVLLGSDLTPILFNRTFAETTGLRPRRVEAEIERRGSVFSLLGNSAKTDLQHAEDAIQTGAPTHLREMDVLNANGERFVMMQSFLPIPGRNGHPVAVIAVFRDQSDEARVHLRYKELLRLEKARSEELENRVAERTQQLSAALDEVTRLSTHDPLTKLSNRRAFDERARFVWADAKTNESPFAILLCDLDHFKKVNDQYGHQAGDRVLIAVAETLTASVREQDTVARFGGEEFVILLGNTNEETAINIAARCASAVRAIPMADLVPGAVRRQTVSIGVATHPGCGESIDDLIANADHALYDAKRSGRDKVVLYSDDRNEAPAQAVEDTRPRLLLIDPDEQRAQRTCSRISQHYAIVTALNGLHALRCCARQPFDIILSEEDVGTESGIAFLRKTFAFAPYAARVLILDNADAFLAIRATNVGRVDQLLLREDSETHLVQALQHARLKLDLAGQHRLGAERQEGVVDVSKLEGLQSIIRAGRLRFAYQPIVQSQDGRIVGFEALARPEPSAFCTPHSNPNAMLEVAEEMGAQWELGRIGRESIAREAMMVPRSMMLFVNIHPAELANEQMLEETGMLEQASRVVLEITERAAIHDAAKYGNQLSRLRQCGFRLAVDDLGAGYSGLNSVAQLQPDFVKVDMALTRAIDRWKIKQHLVEGVVHFARQEGIEVVAEGIETEDEAKMIRDLGCGLQQGFLHGRPEPLSHWSYNAT